METTNGSSQSFFSELVSDIKKSYLDLFRPIILNILFMDISCVKVMMRDELIIWLEKLQASSVYVNTLETIYINQRIIQHLFFIFIGVFFSLIEFFYMLTIQAPGVISYSSFEYITNWMSVCTGVAISIQIKKLFIRVRISSAHLICSSQMGRSGWNYVRLWVDIQYILRVDSRTQ